MLLTSWSGSTVKLALSREEPAQLQIVIIDALMNSEQPWRTERRILQFVFYCLAPLVLTFPVMTAGDAHINRH